MVRSDDVWVPFYLNVLRFHNLSFMSLFWTFVGFWLPRNNPTPGANFCIVKNFLNCKWQQIQLKLVQRERGRGNALAHVSEKPRNSSGFKGLNDPREMCDSNSAFFINILLKTIHPSRIPAIKFSCHSNRIISTVEKYMVSMSNWKTILSTWVKISRKLFSWCIL